MDCMRTLFEILFAAMKPPPTMMFLLARWFIISGLLTEIGHAMISRPRHAVVKVGSNASLICRSNGPESTGMRWDHYPSLSNTSKLVYNGNRFNGSGFSRFQVVRDDSNVQYDLVIMAVQPTDAGTYVCYGPETKEKIAATLTVFADDPACKEVRRGNSSELHCQVNYAGDWPPSFRCLPVDQSTDETTVDIVTSTSVNYQRRRPVHSPEDVNQTTVCEVYFNTSQRRDMQSNDEYSYARNLPDYKWKSTPELELLADETPSTATATTAIDYTTSVTSVSLLTSAPSWVFISVGGTSVVMVMNLILISVICLKKSNKRKHRVYQMHRKPGEHSAAEALSPSTNRHHRRVSAISNTYQEADVGFPQQVTPSLLRKQRDAGCSDADDYRLNGQTSGQCHEYFNLALDAAKLETFGKGK